MNRLIRAELLRARASRTVRTLAVLAPVTCVLWAGLGVALMGTDGPLPADDRVRNVYAMAQQAYVFTLLLGISGTAGEFRHQTITWRFLVTPDRGRVVDAKLAAYGIIGLAVAAVAALATLAAGALLLRLGGHPVTAPGVPAALAGAVVTVTGYGLLGVGLGALIRNQTTAVVVAMLWFMYADYLLTMLLPGLGRWLPAGAARALAGMSIGDAELLPAWAGGALFAAYVLAIVMAARLIALRRDVA
ncbi:ABC transporter permease subunit [Planobispora siamensis]|uniref:ABC transporter permease n=1 Tax=Planobispora siamensis TaxID=936338 RepID=A0A8J3SJA9_9ACTN|nr:ABC transporter permease subunit [Planobispora siamensis]GIH95546.1 ABC transporter permease [Planobispora siamensis]